MERVLCQSRFHGNRRGLDIRLCALSELCRIAENRVEYAMFQNLRGSVGHDRNPKLPNLNSGMKFRCWLHGLRPTHAAQSRECANCHSSQIPPCRVFLWEGTERCQTLG